jgi:heme A synthase
MARWSLFYAMQPTKHPGLSRLALVTVLFNLGVIVWGAWVRASGSGAGCGNHWPLCNGQVFPRSPGLETVIEFTHRTTSGIALLLVMALVLLTWRKLKAGHPARAAAIVALILIVVEALIGAGLVKFDLVADNASMARALTLGAHLINTQFLLAALGLTWWWCAGWPAINLRRLRGKLAWLILGTVALLAVGLSGVVASLGDTLFPARTLSEGFAQDSDPTAHLLLRLRVWHPTLAIVTGVAIWLLGQASLRWRPDEVLMPRLARGLTAMVLIQWTIGATSIILLVPVAMQLLHLLTADILWLTWVALITRALTEPVSSQPLA